MRYQSGQTVTLLDTEYKPAGNAIVRRYDEDSHQYEVDYKYPRNEKTDQISVPEERLILLTDSLKSLFNDL